MRKVFTKIKHFPIGNLGFYILRWQLSTPVLYIVYKLLGSNVETPLYAVVIANFIGALMFYNVDKLIFRSR